jgi:L-asparaginase
MTKEIFMPSGTPQPVHATDISKGFAENPADLSLLKNIAPEKVRIFVQEMNALSPADLKNRDVVAVISTGGTISMKRGADGTLTPDLDFQGIFNRTHQSLNEDFLVRGLDAFCIDSSQMNYSHPRDLVIAMTYIWHNVKIKLAGFMVLHGTDTMSYSSAAVSLMMGPGLPFSVVFTGAQKPIQEPINDASTNIRHAFYTLQALHKQDMAEVIIVMGDVAILATSSEKMDDTQANAFDAPIHRHVARFNRMEHPVPLAAWLRPRRQVAFEPKIWFGDYSHSLIIKSVLGLSPELVARQVRDETVHAVVLYSLGAGTIHEDVIRAILPEAQQKNAPVFIISPVHANIKMTYESTRHLLEQGATPLYMTLSAALAKIELALRMYPGDLAAISRYVAMNDVGEVPTEQSRFLSAR